MPYTSTNPALPSYRLPAAADIALDLERVSDLLGGTRRMHAQSAAYIEKWTAEDADVYRRRRTCEPVFEGFARTLSAAVGLLFAKPPAVTWNRSEAAMRASWDNIDGAGTKWTVFAKRTSEAFLRDGLGVLLVDHPAPPTQPDGTPARVTAELEARLNLRPRWALYPRASVINWQVGVVDNQSAPTLLVFAETATVPVDAYGSGTVDRYRELRTVLTPSGFQAIWRLWERDAAANADEKDAYRLVGEGLFTNREGQTRPTLPVAIGYAGRTDGPLHAGVPLLGCANANIAHWQIASNLRFNTDVCAFEQLVVEGELKGQGGQPGKMRVGPLVGLHVEQGGTVKWIAPSGTGLAQLERRKLEKLTEMAQQGLSFLQPQTRAAETAEAKRLDATAENATLATAAQGIEDAINAAAEIDAWYRGIAPADAPVVSISRDYEGIGMQAPELQAWVRAIVDAGLPARLLLRAMQAGGLIAEDEDIEAIEDEMTVNRAIDQAARDAEMAFARERGGAPADLAA